MNGALSRARSHKQRLIAQAGVQRTQIANAAGPLKGALGKLDRACRVVQSVRWLALPVGIAAVVAGGAFLLFKRTRRKRASAASEMSALPSRPFSEVARNFVRLARVALGWWQVGKMAAGFIAQARHVNGHRQQSAPPPNRVSR
jgi:hypothetical protein